MIYTPKAFKEASYVAKHGSLGFSNLIKLDDDFLDVHPEQTFKHYSDVDSDSDDQDSDSFSEEPPNQTLFTMMDSEAKQLSDSKFGINDQESSSFSSGTDMESEKQLSSWSEEPISEAQKIENDRQNAFIINEEPVVSNSRLGATPNLELKGRSNTTDKNNNIKGLKMSSECMPSNIPTQKKNKSRK